MNTTGHLSFFAIPLLAACGGAATSPPPDAPPPASSRVTVTDLGGGVQRLVVDATDEAAWVEVDLASANEAQGDAWSLRVSRFRIRTNGGVSGDGSMAVAPLPGRALAEVTRAPAEGWVQDAPKEGADPDTPDFVPGADVLGAFERPHDASPTGWYAYDPATHVLSPADVTYAVRGREGGYFALRFVDYYDAAGTPGFVTFDLAEIEAPEAAPANPLAALDANEARWLSVDGAIVDDASGLTWDLGIERTWMRTNSGLSGDGVGGARWAPDGAEFDALTAAPTVGYLQDELLPLPGPPGSGEAPGNRVLNEWYDYDPASHRLSPRSGVLLVRGATGEYAKLAVEGYEDGTYALRVAPLPAAPELASADIALGEAFTLLDLATGEIAQDVVDPAAEDTWDLAFARDRVWTRQGAAALEDFSAAAAAARDRYVLDEGVGAARAHAALTAALGTGGAFALPVGAGMGLAKVDLQVSDAGLSIEWAYTGPNRETFR